MTLPRRVLMTCDALGGVWRYAVDLAHILRDAGTTTLLVGTGPPPARAALEADLDGLELEWIDCPPAWMAPEPGAVQCLAGALAGLAREFRADLLHLNQLAEAAGLDVETPVSVGAHSCLATWWDAVKDGSPPSEWSWRIDLDRAGLRRADAVVAPSHSHAAAMQRVYGLKLRPHVASNACAAPPSPGRKGEFVLAAARWWDAAKNAAALDAAAQDCPWPLLACGSTRGPDGTSFEFRHARSLGPCASDKMSEIISAAPVFVSPSLYEPFGLAVLEAAHAGAALVLSDIPIYRELWEGAAIFVDSRDPEQLRPAISSVAEDAGLRSRLSAAAKERAKGFSPQRQMAEIRTVYDAATTAEQAARRLALNVAQ